MKTVAEVLRGAVTVLDERGWMQGNYSDAAGRVCVMGALRLAVGCERPDEPPYTRSEWTAYNGAWDALDVHLELGLDALVTEWNDAEGRTVDEVKAALLAAAERAEAGA